MKTKRLQCKIRRLFCKLGLATAIFWGSNSVAQAQLGVNWMKTFVFGTDTGVYTLQDRASSIVQINENELMYTGQSASSPIIGRVSLEDGTELNSQFFYSQFAYNYGYPGSKIIKTQEGGNNGETMVLAQKVDTIIPHYSLWLIKVDANGDTIWTAEHTSSIVNETIYYKDLVQDQDNNYLVSAEINSFNPARYFAKFSSSGDLIWEKLYPFDFSNNNVFTHMEFVEDINGYFWVVDAMVDSSNSDNYQNLLLWNLDVNGDTNFTKRVLVSDYNYLPIHVVKSSNDEIMILGQNVNYPESIYDLSLMKLDMNGDLIWEQSYDIQTEYPGLMDQKLLELGDQQGYLILYTVANNSDQGYWYASSILTVDVNGDSIGLTDVFHPDMLDYPAGCFGRDIIETNNGGFVIAGQCSSEIDSVSSYVCIMGLDSSAYNPCQASFEYEILDEEYGLVGITNTSTGGYVDALMHYGDNEIWWEDNWETITDSIEHYYFYTDTNYTVTLMLQNYSGQVCDSISQVVSLVSDSVWPGDANNDGVVTAEDVFPIGLGYETTGSVRQGASNVWFGQPANDWSQNFTSGSNYKYADCNGDGIINNDDTTAILLNFGLIHNKTEDNTTTTDPTLYYEIPTDTAFAGMALSIPVMLGDMDIPVENAYGISFAIVYDPSLVDSSSVHLSFENSWLGNLNEDMITVQKNFSMEGELHVGMVRTDQQNIASAFGQIATLQIIMDENLTGKNENLYVDLLLSFSNIHAISADESLIAINSNPSTVVVTDVVSGIKEIELNNDILVYPQPATNQLYISSNESLNKLEIIDVNGCMILQKNLGINNTIHKLDINTISEGLYFVKVYSIDNQVKVKKVIIQ